MRRYIGPLVYLGITLCASPATAGPAPDGEQMSPVETVQSRGALFLGLSDEAAMVLAGTALIGAAAAVRRAV